MIKAFFIFLSNNEWIKGIIMRLGFAKKAASRFIAGETLEDAVRVAGALNREGFFVTLDPLGEHTTTETDARQAVSDIKELITEIHHKNLHASVSIKLTQIGLTLNKALCKFNLDEILQHAKLHGVFIRIDMEDSSLTNDTIDLAFFAQDIWKNSGTVIQSYLYRSEKDTGDLLEKCISIRMVKGAYKEPSDIAYPNKKDVDKNFDHLCKMIAKNARACSKSDGHSNGNNPPLMAVGTHDEERIQKIIGYAQKNSLEKEFVEIQMLYGIRKDLQEKFLLLGFPVRIYVPYGTSWYPYFMRRIAERPANFWFFISHLLRR